MNASWQDRRMTSLGRLWLARRLSKRLPNKTRDPRDIPGLFVWWSAEHGGPPPTPQGTRIKRTRSRPLVRLIAWLER